MKKKSLIFLGLVSMLATACIDNDDPKNPTDPHDEELITTLELQFIDTLNQDTLRFVYADPDGDGGNDPITWDTIRLDKDAYWVNLNVYDESVNEKITIITPEIEEEGDEHQFFFIDALNTVDVEYDDADENGNPIGIKTYWRIVESGNSTMRVVLKHQPDGKPAAPGDINVGSTDIDVTFQMEIQ